MTHQLHETHNRAFESNRFVYPVLSRRSQGISIGVNLNPDKVCNFDCVYCQVDRVSASETRFVSIDQLQDELRMMLQMAASGELFETKTFASVPTELRRINDIAFSGDGEPTTYKNFPELIQSCAEIKAELGLSDVKMVLITNASMFHRDFVEAGLKVLDQNNGEIWAKLDAGTDAYFEQVNRSKFSLSNIVENITRAANVRPLVIQTLFMRIDDKPPSENEIDQYIAQLNSVQSNGGQLKLIQVYSIARQTTERNVTPLYNQEVDELVDKISDKTGVNTVGFYGKPTE